MNIITLLLPYQPPWDWQQFHGHFALRAIPGLESLSANSYCRGFSIDGTPGWFRVAPLPGQNALELRCHLASPAHLDQLEQRVRRMFDLDSEPETIVRHLSADELLAEALDTGYTVTVTKYTERIGHLPKEERQRIYQVLDTMLRHAEKKASDRT